VTIAFFAALLVLVGTAYLLGRGRGVAFAGEATAHSRPAYHGAFLALALLLPMFAVYVVGTPIAGRVVTERALSELAPDVVSDELRRGAALREIMSTADGEVAGEPSPEIRAAASRYASDRAAAHWLVLLGSVGLGLLSALWAWRRLSPVFRARNQVERIVKIALLLSAAIAILTTIGIVFSVLFESIRFFQRVPFEEFLFGTQWSPQTAIREDQVGSSGAFGIVPLVTGTLLITVIAMLVAGPIGLFAAIYMSEYAGPRFRAIAKPLLEILAGIPTVVLGFFAALTVAPLIRQFGDQLGLNVASESALAAGLVMGTMIIPFVSSLSDDVISAVPQSLRDGSLAMGATRSETIKRVVLPAALPGIVSAMMLAISRAVGETMIVVMAAGLAANLTFNPFEAVTTFTVQIKTILVGDQEFDSAKTLAAFALGLVLFLFTLALNVVALTIVRRYREQYD
jgi:phosphate transport system permease protein